jgi:uncharacterized protein YcaQ
LSTSHRENFAKFYDLTERVIPQSVRETEFDDAIQLDELCHGALRRMGFGSTGDIQRFWDAADSSEVRDWTIRNEAKLVPTTIETSDGTWFDAYAPADIEQTLAHSPAPTSRLRILNPFDPAIRDRTRLARLFGFEYRIEMFVPAKKRRWGYYVFPLLEGDRFVGRIEVRANRKAGCLELLNLWREPKTMWSNTREVKLQVELRRLARFVGVDILSEVLDPKPAEF